ncbi:MAG: phosphate uptake regulator PhoU [Nitrosopumilaceae archaeon]|nr:phosphate uptake regulator PhoU [Nitrosopumilaceae archaeon]
MARFLRRLQRIGSSVLVSLPKEWVVQNGLEKGSQVEIETSKGGLSVAATGRRTRELSIAYPLPPNENITADLTGAYLLGYDMIQVTSGPAIPAGDRELIRDSTRRLAGMEIVEEDSSHITLQFLLDPTTLDPRRILLRMNSIALGMFGEVLKGMETGEFSALGTLRNRDAEVNRQYFLLVRLIRSALVDGRISHAFDLEGVDVLDYRVAANLLENAGDSIAALGAAIRDSGLPAGRLRGARGAARDLEGTAGKAVRALVERDRRLAIEAISLHAAYQERLAALRADAAGDMALVDVVYGLERIGRFWADVADLVRPIYYDE